MKSFTLKKGHDFRFRSGHPWIFSNELLSSPKESLPGETIELKDIRGQTLGRGHGHPNSLIAFRCLSRGDEDIDQVDFFERRLESALQKRVDFFATHQSFRLVYSEADGLSGLIIDRYLLKSGPQVFVIQPSSSGMDQRIPLIVEGLKRLVAKQLPTSSLAGETAILLSLNSKARALENLPMKGREIIEDFASVETWKQAIIVPHSQGSIVEIQTDLLEGQKTGFFLDQSFNTESLIRLLPQKFTSLENIHVLDLFCYVGQWASKIANHYQGLTEKVSIDLVDVSQDALKWAERNVARYGVSRVRAHEQDVMKSLGQFAEKSYEIVVCDPPALIKKRKDLPEGKAAYLKLNRDALKKVVRGGLFVSCSCSGLLAKEDFDAIITDAARKAGRELELLVRGRQGLDHPLMVGFPEGEYLKGNIYSVTS